jgi:hypothetical protein
MNKKMKIIGLVILLWTARPQTAMAQLPIKDDIKTFVQAIPVLPANPQELHEAFTIKTKYGDKFGDGEKLDPVYEKVKGWVSALHKETILKKMKNSPRTDMSFEVQYEDERWQLAIRPFRGAQLEKKAATLGGDAKDLVKQLVCLEKVFDWQQYYKAYDKIRKEADALQAERSVKAFHLEEKVPMLQTEWGLQKDAEKLAVVTAQIAREKVQADRHTFQLQRDTWSKYFEKYTAAAIQLQQLLLAVDYGQKLSADEQKLLLPAITDIQARSLEAIEKMIWQEMTLVAQGELLWFDLRLIKFIDSGVDKSRGN